MSNMRKVILCVVLVFLVLLSSIFLVPQEKAEQAALIGLCSDSSKETMKSPDSYVMISASQNMSIGLPEVGTKMTNEESLKKLILSGDVLYRLANVTVKQKAQNSFGVSLSGESYCQFAIFGSGPIASYKIISMNIDGRNIPDWQLSVLSKGAEHKIARRGYMNRVMYLWYGITGKI